MSDLRDIPISQIAVSDDRARGLDPAWVEGLAAIIEAEGLIQPIAVQANGEAFQLIAGGHRLAACKGLRWKAIPAVIYSEDFGDADLIETLENLARRELSALDRAKHLARFKDAYEAKHGAIERGGDRKSAKVQDQSADIALWSFHETVAEKTGLSRRSVFSYISVWNGLLPAGYERLCTLEGLASNLSQLKQLSEQSHDRQDQALGLIETDPKISTVGDALNALDGIERQPVGEKKVTVARGAWARLNQEQRFEFLSGCEDEVRQYAIQKGWINV